MKLAQDKKTIDGVHLRWMIRRDMPEVYGIENANFEFPWCEDELHKRHIELLNIAVHASMHRQGIGFAMIRKLHSKLAPQRRTSIAALVSERNLDAQLFFRAMGFRATEICTVQSWDGLMEWESYRFVLEAA